MDRTGNTELIDRFEQFYRDYYRNEIGELAQKYPDEQRTLYIDWDELYRFDPDLADDFVAQPEQMRDYAEEALRLYDLPVDVKLGRAHVRVRNLRERVKLADIRAGHRGQLIDVYGTVKNASTPRSVPTEAAFECQRCGTLARNPQSVHSDEIAEPEECRGCERQGPFSINADQSEYIDVQTLLLEQRGPNGTDSETESIVVEIEDDLVESASIGDHVTITGVLHFEEYDSFNEGSLSDKYLRAMAIEPSSPFEHLEISEEDEREIVALSEEEDLYDRLIDSIAPTVYDNEDAKLALAMQLFGGVTKNLPDGERIRGDIHVLLVGDPAAGQSRLTRHVARVAPRSMRVSGKTTTQAGLTATAHLTSGEGSPWDVEGGALVLADKGLTAIDRIDAMRQDARESLPAVLDEQAVHVTKATITETLNARTSLLAQAAPKYGRFDQYEPLGEQVDMAPDLISQFDLLFILTDDPEQERDDAEASHIIDLNYAGETRANRSQSPSPIVAPSTVEEANDAIEPSIDLDLLRRYIAYARQNCFPVLTDEAKEAIQEFYVDLRSEGYDEDAPIPATSRKLEAIIRLAEASARMRLSDTVEKEDADRATELVQDTLKAIGVDTETGEFDADVVETGTSESERSLKATLLGIIEEVQQKSDSGAPVQQVIDRAEEEGIPPEKTEHKLSEFKKRGDIYEPESGIVRMI